VNLGEDGGTLILTPAQWAAFIGGVRNGEFWRAGPAWRSGPFLLGVDGGG
jgi:hypothetical protein